MEYPVFVKHYRDIALIVGDESAIVFGYIVFLCNNPSGFSTVTLQDIADYKNCSTKQASRYLETLASFELILKVLHKTYFTISITTKAMGIIHESDKKWANRYLEKDENVLENKTKMSVDIDKNVRAKRQKCPSKKTKMSFSSIQVKEYKNLKNIKNTVKEKKDNEKIVLSTSLQEHKPMSELSSSELINPIRKLLFEIFGEYHKRNKRNFSPSEKDLGCLTNLSKKFSIEYRNNDEAERLIRQDCFTFYNYICQRPGGSGNFKYENISFTPSMMIAWLDKARTIRENEELQTFKEIDKEIHRIFKSSLNPWSSLNKEQVNRAYYLGYEPPKKQEPSLEGTVKSSVDKLDEVTDLIKQVKK